MQTTAGGQQFDEANLLKPVGMGEIMTIHGPMVEASLLKSFQGVWLDDENETETAIEYCLSDCPGSAHRTNVRDSTGHFCNLHIHRSANKALKKSVFAEGIAASFA